MSELAWPTISSRRTLVLTRTAGVTGLALVSVSGALIAIGSASHGAGVVAGARHLRGALASPLAGVAVPLTHNRFLVLLLIMAAGYLLALLGAREIDARLALGAVVGLHVLFALAPPLLSTDVFSYIDYARLGAVHGLNPYVDAPAAAPHDPSFALTGRTWKHTPSTYGPLFTLLGYPLARLGVAASMWGEKAITAVAGLACVAAVWGCARARFRPALPAALLVGLNPVFLVYGVGGAHNDLLMLALLMGGVLLVLRGRAAGGAATVVAAAAVKATAGVALPFLLAGQRARWRAVAAGALAAALVVAAVDLAAFGTGGAHVAASLSRQQARVSHDAFPTRIAHLAGLPGVFPTDRLALRLLAAAALLVLLWAVWRGLDWLAGTGWAIVVLLVTATWLQAWYVLWPLPLAAVAGDRRLLVAVLLLEALFLVTQLGPLLA